MFLQLTSNNVNINSHEKSNSRSQLLHYFIKEIKGSLLSNISMVNVIAWEKVNGGFWVNAYNIVTWLQSTRSMTCPRGFGNGHPNMNFCNSLIGKSEQFKTIYMIWGHPKQDHLKIAFLKGVSTPTASFTSSTFWIDVGTWLGMNGSFWSQRWFFVCSHNHRLFRTASLIVIL